MRLVIDAVTSLYVPPAANENVRTRYFYPNRVRYAVTAISDLTRI